MPVISTEEVKLSAEEEAAKNGPEATLDPSPSVVKDIPMSKMQ